MLDVIDIGSLTDVGDAVGRSQQTISHSIHALEDELGVRLFERSSLGAVPTRAALVLGERVRGAVAHLGKARQIASLHGTARKTRGLRVWDFNVANQQIFVFLSLCDFREVKRVAGDLNMDVSAVRKAIRALEGQVGHTLFDKVSRGSHIPTDFAELLSRQIRLALAEIRAGIDELNSLDGTIQGEVIIGAAPHARTLLLPRIVARLHAKYPRLSLSMRYDSYEQLERGVSHRDVDFILGSERAHPASPDVVAFPLLQDRLEILARADHPLFNSARPGTARVLGAQWVLPPLSVPLRGRFSDTLRKLGFAEPMPVFETGDIEIIKGMLLETDCLALGLRSEFAREVDRGVLAFLRCPMELASLVRAPVTLHLTFPAHAIRSPSAQAFYDEALSVATAFEHKESRHSSQAGSAATAEVE